MSIEVTSSSAGNVPASDSSAKGRGNAAAGAGNFLDLLTRMGEQGLAGLGLETGQDGAAAAGLAQAGLGDKKGADKPEMDAAAVAALQAWMAAHQGAQGSSGGKGLQGISLKPADHQAKDETADGAEVMAGLLQGVMPQMPQGLAALTGALHRGDAAQKEGVLDVLGGGKGGASKGRSQTQLLQMAAGGREALAAAQAAAQSGAPTTAQLSGGLNNDANVANARGDALGRSGGDMASLLQEMKPVAGAVDGALAASGVAHGFRQALADAAGSGRAGAADAAWGMQALVNDRMTDVSTVADSGGAQGPSAQEAAVADQVSYWIANDVQKAELRLDPWGRDPVDVSLSLQGNEAHVEFRSDVPEVRQMLEGAMAQLQSALHDQGLVLAGASVGQFGAGNAGQREQSGRQEQPGGRQGTARVEAAGAADIPRVRVSRTGERSVDVFV